MSTYEQFVQQGRIEGRIKGKMEGKMEARVGIAKRLSAKGVTIRLDAY